MAPLHSHRDAPSDSGRANRRPFARLIGWLRDALRMIHHAIVAAKLRRLRSELMFHPHAEADAAKFPQHPLILGDKWDF